MLDSYYALVFVDMFLGCLVGYLLAPYVKVGLLKLKRKFVPPDIYPAEITLSEAKELYAEKVLELASEHISKIQEKIMDKEFQTSGDDVYISETIHSKDVASHVFDYFQDCGFSTTLIGNTPIILYVFIEEGEKIEVPEWKEDEVKSSTKS